MTRAEFLRMSAAMGIGVGLMPSLLTSCSKEDELQVNFDGSVIIIGAGAAGLMAGYTLYQHGIDFTILEASSVFGGRVAQNTSLCDFPIDIGAEWIHEQPSILGKLINDSNAQGSMDLIPYQLETMYTWNNNQLNAINWADTFYGEYKFKSSTWYQFFEQFIVPKFADKIIYDAPVASINYTGDRVELDDIHGVAHQCDKVIVTVPLNVLKNDSINFIPSWPQSKVDALNKTSMPPGIKVFIKFAEKFYPDILVMGGLTGDEAMEKLYFDGAFKKDTNDNLLTLFYVGENANQLTDLTDQQIIDTIIAELDEIFDGKATQHYQSHIIQNWSKSPYVLGSYSHYGNDYAEIMDALSAPLDSKVYFAGEALQRNDWSTVHGAGLSGREVAETILTGS